MFKTIDHVEIVTDQLDRTVQFYTEILGFTVKARDRIDEGASIDPAPQTEHLKDSCFMTLRRIA